MKFSGFMTLITGLFFYFLPVRAQFYSTGEAPSSIRWMQVSTPRFKVVYPEYLQRDAARLINELEATQSLTVKPYSLPAKPVPVLLHSSSVISNGYVTWAPRRMELVTTPPQDSYAQDWISQLSLHEYRHVVQISQLCQGTTSALSYLTGEIAPGGMSSLIPSWFYEGDAVLNETRNSRSGRGRVAGFEMPLRAILLGGRPRFSYNKAFFGSYRDFVPDHYQYGYQMVSYAATRFGNDIWSGALNYTARNPYLIWPLAFYLKRNFGIYKSGLYKRALDSLNSLYNNQEKSSTYCNYSIKNERKQGDYTSYKLPHDLGRGDILSLKTGIDLRDRFVIVDSMGRERKLLTPGMTSGLKADVNEHYLVWDEVTADPRWGRRDYSEIRLFDLKTLQWRTLVKRTRYFSPDFSPDGKTIAVAETDLMDNHFLTLLSTKTGQSILRIPSPENRAIQFPEWVSGTCVAVITVSAKGKQIEQVNTDSKTWRVILPHTHFDISEPTHFRQFILFRSAYYGIENIFALDTARSQLYQVTFSRFGAFNPSVSADSTTLLFSDYSEQGYNISQASLVPSSWKAIRVDTDPSGIWPGTGPFADTTGRTAPAGLIPQGDVRPYRKGAHLIRFHSWLPLYTPVDAFARQIRDLPVKPGFMLFSQNLLSTFISSIGYHYSGGYHYLTPRFIWSGWFPVIELSGQLGGPARTLPLPEGISLPDHTNPYLEYRVKTYVPLTFSRSRYLTYLQPQLEYQRSSDYYYSGDRLRQGIDYLHYRLYMTRYLRMAYRDLYPRLGQYVSVTYTDTPSDLRQFGSLFSFLAGGYFPGITAHHHLLLKAGYQKQYAGKYYLPVNRISFPRGYPSAVSGELTAFSVDYAFPVAYPDFSLGPVIYLKRLRADLFHDRSYGTNILEAGNQRYTGNYRSTGLEILADFHIARIIFPVSAGVRMGYKHNKNQLFTEFLLSIQTNTL